jgi:WhiB family redox-sensing transcriptional regulator
VIGIEYPLWTIDALCAEVGPSAFFPKRGGSTADAKAICAQCPVREKCLEWALSCEAGEMNGADWMASYGIYGGLSAQERRAVLRERAGERKAS